MKNMNLLFTGASGFIGNNIVPELKRDYNLKTLGLFEHDNYYVMLDKTIPVFEESFDIVLHAAGKAHFIPGTESERQLFFDVNLQGTKNLCKGLERSGIPKSFIFISTVAVYGLDSGENITEEYPLAGNSPYALSKIQAEEFLIDWCKKHHVILTILRPSLIAGPNPPGNLGAMIKGIKSGRYLSIDGGKARKSVLMVQDIAALIPILSEKGGIYNICDSLHPSFRDLERIIAAQLQKPLPLVVPYFLARILAVLGNLLGDRSPFNTEKLKKITSSLTFSNEKAVRELNWTPTSVIDNLKI